MMDPNTNEFRSLTEEEERQASLFLEARYRKALEKIDEIRNSIVGKQTVNWSAHIYPLVAALEEAGFRGLGYEEARSRYGYSTPNENGSK